MRFIVHPWSGVLSALQMVVKAAEAAGGHLFAPDGCGAWETAAMQRQQGDSAEVVLDRPRKGVEMFSGRSFSVDARIPLPVPNPGSPALFVWEPDDFNK